MKLEQRVEALEKDISEIKKAAQQQAAEKQVTFYATKFEITKDNGATAVRLGRIS